MVRVRGCLIIATLVAVSFLLQVQSQTNTKDLRKCLNRCEQMYTQCMYTCGPKTNPCKNCTKMRKSSREICYKNNKTRKRRHLTANYEHKAKWRRFLDSLGKTADNVAVEQWNVLQHLVVCATPSCMCNTYIVVNQHLVVCADWSHS